jgi:hypothetical protein
MVDTCAGLNVGILSYHKSIAERYPTLVHQFGYIKDFEAVEEFNIGGINKNADGMKVVALISYKMPLRIGGCPVLWTVALAEEAAANTVLGIPFLRATRSALLLDEQGKDVLVVQKFGSTFPVEFHAPRADGTAPQADLRSQATFLVNPTAEVDRMRERLATDLSLASTEPKDLSSARAPVFHAATEFKTESLPQWAE